MADPQVQTQTQTQQQVPEPALQPARYCSKCGKVPGDETRQTCGQCRVVFYCSRDCQKADWHLHKQFCTIWAEQKGRVTICGPPVSLTGEWTRRHQYWHLEASRDPAAQQLTAAVGISLVSECPGQSCRAIDATLSHLICTGKDTDNNLALFFGEDEVSPIKNTTLYHELRYTAFNRAPVGSYAFHAAQTWDRDMSQLCWTPRQAPDFKHKFLLQQLYWIKVCEFFDTSKTVDKLTQQDMTSLLGFLAAEVGDEAWPFQGDNLDTVGALRAALQTIPDRKMSVDLESLGMGVWHIPDEIPVLMRRERIGLKEAAKRVLGEDSGNHCPDCGCSYPVPYLG